MALRNITRRPIRSSLTILGVALSVMLILSVGVSTLQYATLVRESRLLYGNRLIVIAKGAYFAEAVPIGSSLSNTTTAVVNALPGVTHAASILTLVTFQGLVPSNVTFAIPPADWQNIFENLKLATGKLPQQDSEVVIGSFVAASNQLHIDSTLKIFSNSLTVSGTLLPSQSPVADHSIFMTLSEGQKLYGYQGLITMIAVTPTTDANLASLQMEIGQALPGANVLTEEQRGADAEPLLQQFVSWSSGIEVVAFILSTLFIATLSLINVFERRRELAATYAIGATRRTLLRIAILENAFIGIIGGLIGVLLGIINTAFVNLSFSTTPTAVTLSNIPNLIPPEAALAVLLSTILVSTVTGGLVYLASMRRDVASILRYEA